jgi:serine/threonine protein kinase
MQGSASSCLDDHTLYSLASGGLDGERLPAAEAHIGHCARCQRAVSEIASNLSDTIDSTSESGVSRKPLGETVSASTASPAPPSKLELPLHGTIIGERYRVDRWLGGGGMGSVLAATHLGLEQRVAIKVLRLLEPESAARFTREGRTLAQLCSQHIVRVYDSGQLPNGTPYIVMEQLEGEDLSVRVKQGAIAIRDAVNYVRQACIAVQTAHTAGIIHRDLKPSNLFLTQHNGLPVLKVLDFGISKNIRSSGASDDHASITLTGPGDIVGSPRYMSPEQLYGSRALDHRTDVWSLGVILYELLTGEHPFRHATFAAVAIAIATASPRPPSTLRQDIPGGLDAIVMRCLEKEPARRFGSADELSAALAPFEVANAARDDATASPSPPSPTRPRARRILVAIALAAVCVSAFVWSGRQGTRQPSAAPAAAVRPSVPEAAPTPPVEPRPVESREPREPHEQNEAVHGAPVEATPPAPPRKPKPARRASGATPSSAKHPAPAPPVQPPTKRPIGLSATPD